MMFKVKECLQEDGRKLYVIYEALRSTPVEVCRGYSKTKIDTICAMLNDKSAIVIITIERRNENGCNY